MRASVGPPSRPSSAASLPDLPTPRAPCTLAVSPSNTLVSPRLLSLAHPPLPHTQPVSSLFHPPSPQLPPPSLPPVLKRPSQFLPALFDIPSPLPGDPFSLRTLFFHPLHTALRLRPCITSLPPLRCSHPAQTSPLSPQHGPRNPSPIHLLLCTALRSLLLALPPHSVPTHAPWCWI